MSVDDPLEQSSDSVLTEIDISVENASEQIFKCTPQTLNRWCREIERDYPPLKVGYIKGKARWLRPIDIENIRKYKEGVLEPPESSQQSSEEYQHDDRGVEEAADEGFLTFSTIADQADEEISKALAIRDNFVEDRAEIIALEFSPNTIARDILTKAIDKIEKGTRESLGEIAKGGMHRQFRRKTIPVEPIRSLKGSTSPRSLESSPPQE